MTTNKPPTAVEKRSQRFFDRIRELVIRAGGYETTAETVRPMGLLMVPYRLQIETPLGLLGITPEVTKSFVTVFCRFADVDRIKRALAMKGQRGSDANALLRPVNIHSGKWNQMFMYGRDYGTAQEVSDSMVAYFEKLLDGVMKLKVKG